MNRFTLFTAVLSAVAAFASSCEPSGDHCSCSWSDSNGHHTIYKDRPEGVDCAKDAYVEGHPEAVCK